MRNTMLALAATAALTCTPAWASDDLADWSPRPYVELEHPEWSRDAVLYQINTRQFTAEGTFRAAEKELPRLKALGVDILWLMPIHPIGEKNRKGTLGSPYAVKDYYDVNPEFGTKEDFRHFVEAAHAQGFKVILDWVANHTAWDHPLAQQHPDWYEKDWKGDFRPTPWWDWSDIIDLDWSQPGVRKHVGEAMEMWVRDYGVDGFRADVAGYVPIDFWETLRARLDAIRPVFMLAEWKEPELHRRAFDATYAWEWHHTTKRIAKGEADATALFGYYAESESAWPAEAMRLTYIANHDSNAWEGTQYENYGAALPAMIAFSFTGEGLPMIYNGQEACSAKRLEFFEKDPIDWSQREDCELGELFRDMIAFRRANPALENGQWGARMQQVVTDQPQRLFAWVRQEEGNKVLGLFNFSGEAVEAVLGDGLAAGTYRAFRTGEEQSFAAGDTVNLPAWGWQLYSAQTGR
ncbi:alpha-amylase family glycosyl hydrolase [Altererythrobacter arenosus]|uniref:Alpha-amylase family glycosyl hydrolase n=1 Tax=Altererythrobacter arenosus TaxID=3032592 RepID=A0ABY8FR70_9SPHN|nr:alpha-amylase family glycosyl hydrolase [Altererythrobacter sp. CAU 1644]WFL76398.1 alpha-amylase family glycosyl hydrolase [Altererythrobacter sp. CAU 1644]